MESEEDQGLLWKMIMKCADLSNTTKSHDVYTEWTNRIMTEFFQQGDEEKRRHMPVSPLMDRETVDIPRSQHTFISILILPLYEALNKFAKIPRHITTLEKRRDDWELRMNTGSTTSMRKPP